MDGNLVVGHFEDFVEELDHLVQVDDDSDDENHEQCGGKVVVRFGHIPEHHAENQEDVERLDYLLHRQL